MADAPEYDGEKKFIFTWELYRIFFLAELPEKT
jgi:hypothetical protein